MGQTGLTKSDEFDLGVKSGTWLFLFDSFDEIPAILSSTDADSAINAYAQAIWDFLNGLNRCRGIVASRLFRGPRQLGWPRFQIVPLSSRREAELVRNSGLKRQVREELLGKLASASSDLQMMASNPMFLGLLCEHMRAGQGFPTNSHTVFETYVNTRLHRDEYRVQQRFQISINQLRDTAEAVAFCMSADNDLGLNPARTSLSASLTKFDFSLDDAFSKVLDALAFIKLAQSESDTGGVAPKNFTFAHRRFQEYFSTRVVLRNPGKVNPRMLLIDARWRETAVVLCQTRKPDALAPLLSQAEALLSAMTLEIRHSLLDSSPKRPFAWPLGCLHLLGLLQDGFAGRLAELPNSIRELAGQIITAGSENGILADRKWAMEVAGCVLESDLFTLTRASFSSFSRWLRDAAFRQVGRLADVPNDIAEQVRSEILQMAFEGRLRKDRQTVRALLSRFPNARSFLHAEHIAEWLPWVDLILLFIAALASIYWKMSAQHAAMSFVSVIVAAVTIRIWAESGFPSQFGSKASLGRRNAMSGKMNWLLFLAVEWAIFARMLLVQLFPYSNFHEKTHFGLVGLVTPPLTVCAFWGPAAALTLTKNGTGVIRGFSPVVLPYAKQVVEEVKSMLKDWKVTLGTLGTMGAVTAASFGLWWLFGKLAGVFPEFSAWVKTHALIYLGLAALAVAAVGLTVYVVVFLLDRSRAKGFILNARGSCNLRDVLAALEHFRFNSSRVWLLREIRRRNLIEVDATVEADLKSFIASYERDLDSSQRRWGRDVLDEFSMMLEQIPGRRNAPAVVDPPSLVAHPHPSNSPGTIQTTWATPQN